MHEHHARALAMQREELWGEGGVLAVLLQGSVARGDSRPGSDLDLLVILAEGAASGFETFHVDGVRVEQHRTTSSELRRTLRLRPELGYGVLEASSLFDRAGVVPAVRDAARQALAGYAPEAEERARLAYWLVTAAEKVEAARDAGDELRAALVTAATTWTLLEGVFAANGSPTPPVGSLPAHLARLPRPPSGEALRRLLLGEATERHAAFAELARWTAAALDAPGGDQDRGPG